MQRLFASNILNEAQVVQLVPSPPSGHVAHLAPHVKQVVLDKY